MVAQSFLTRTPEETIDLGRRLARELNPPIVILLIGDLGAGKTTLTKGLVAGLGAASEEDVTSPTFTLVHEYGQGLGGVPRVYHVDLYRIETPRDLGTLALEDLVSERAVVIIEWGEKLGSSFRNPWTGSRVMEIRMEAVDDAGRKIDIQQAEPGGQSSEK